MPLKAEEQQEREIAEAAYWRVAKPDLSVAELAEELGLNRTTLDRRISAAKEKEWIANDWIFKGPSEHLWQVLSRTTHKALVDAMARIEQFVHTL